MTYTTHHVEDPCQTRFDCAPHRTAPHLAWRWHRAQGPGHRTDNKPKRLMSDLSQISHPIRSGSACRSQGTALGRPFDRLMANGVDPRHIPNQAKMASSACIASASSYQTNSTRYLGRIRCASGSAPPALTSPSEKLVCMSFTLGRLSNTSRANCEKLSRSRATTCSSNVPVPLM